METAITFALGLLSGMLTLGIIFNIKTLIGLNRQIASLQRSTRGQQSDCDQRFATRDQRVKDAHTELRSELNRIYDQIGQTNTLVYTTRNEASNEIGKLRDEIKKELAGMDNSVNTSRISALEQDMAGFGFNVRTIESKIESIDEEVDSVRNELDGLDTSDIESRIDDLESSLEDTNDTVRGIESDIEEINETIEEKIEDTIDALSMRMDSMFASKEDATAPLNS